MQAAWYKHPLQDSLLLVHYQGARNVGQGLEAQEELERPSLGKN